MRIREVKIFNKVVKVDENPNTRLPHFYIRTSTDCLGSSFERPLIIERPTCDEKGMSVPKGDSTRNFCNDWKIKVSTDTKMAIKILLVDDHRIVLDGLKSLFENDPEFEISGAVSSPAEALEKMKTQRPDILLTDYTLPGMTGLELSTEVKELYPQVKRVILSMHDEGHLVKQVMKEGVDGYLLKSIQQGELKAALRQIMQGMPFISPEITRQLMTRLAHEGKNELLTEREQEIVRLIVKEFSNKQIAEKLFISERTVETHRKNIFRKTNTSSLVGLVKFAFEHNIT